MKTKSDRIWQTLGLVVGTFPVILLSYGFILGIMTFIVICAVGMLSPRFRSFFYGLLCSVLTLPGLVIGLLLVT